ncbi:hypothetical protein FHS18_006037 [Paenibacillus phyllosphaerae]|uniref:Uncharacterized protein n=1 Tax=Paenibacillus phyllosphaerae TaxID=274593 RepID=A0A7W5FR47_9BACL|nr:hypothetical protein [Paenibacillus phyllosphaerae]MBB3113922.1 hypothetical protein [Paenibacillus phyllosphaerae]
MTKYKLKRIQFILFLAAALVVAAIAIYQSSRVEPEHSASGVQGGTKLYMTDPNKTED